MATTRHNRHEIPAGTVHRTIGLLDGALRQLGLEPDDHATERIGVMVNRAMSAQQRSFHTPEHIFDLADPEDPHITLAALFHDLVYYQVDRGFSEEIADLLEPYIVMNGDSLALRATIADHDRAFHGCAAVFGFHPGDTLSPFGGLNELLRALAMDVLLEGTVDDVDLLIATACIEATIPFRPADAEGRRPPELLAHRLAATNEQFGLGLSEDQLDRAIIAAVSFANRDVRNFAEDDVARFLDNTWKLLPESNPTLRFRGLYTIDAYATALLKMHGFLRSLKPDTVFHQYKGAPSPEDHDRLLQLATRNLGTGRRYLGIKLMSAGILHALAQTTGGDAPVALFMGDLNPQEEGSHLAAHLPKRPTNCGRADDETDDLYRLLAHGRASESRFDLQHSPLSLFVYRCLADDQLDAGVAAAGEMFAGKRTPQQFLDDLPGKTVAAIARAAAFMAFTRARELNAIADRREQ